MKIRIHDKNIRVRLSSNDIEELKNNGKLVESLPFANFKTFQFQLVLSKKDDVILEENAMTITIGKIDFLQKEDASIKWITKEDLKVLVETDFYG